MPMHSTKIRQALNQFDVCFIRFVKKNGEMRNMICTIKPTMIPRDKHPMGVMDYDQDEQVRVFDIVAQAWRSMIPDNVYEVRQYGSEIAEQLVP
jgi:hypothetical protein